MPVTINSNSSIKYNDNGEYKTIFPTVIPITLNGYRTAAEQDTLDMEKAAVSSVPNASNVSNTGIISIKHDNIELFTIQLPLYNGGVSNGT